MDEKQKEIIKKEAKEILDKFASALDRVKLKEKAGGKEIGGYRKEKEGLQCDSGFREKMFENAPNKEGDCIVAEKKSW